MRNTWLIAKREFYAQVSKRATVVVTIVMMLLIVIGGAAIKFFVVDKMDENATKTVGVSVAAEDFGPILEATGTAQDKPLTTMVVEETAANDALNDGVIDAWVDTSPEGIELRLKSSPGDPQMIQVVSGAAHTYALSNEITSLGGDPSVVLADVAKATPTITFAESNSFFDSGAFVIGFIVITFLFFGVMFAGQLVSVGVVEEKASRVVEILLSTVKARHLFAGKILGIGLFTILQLGLFTAVMYGVAAWAGLVDMLEVPLGPALAWAALWFLIGYFLYVILWGALSAMVTRQEDIGAIATPMIFLALAPFYLGLYLVPAQPDTTLTQILSLIPFLTPFLMPMRQAMDAVPMWELGLGVAINLAAIAAVIWLSGVIYRKAVLHSGSRMTFKQLFSKAA